MNKTRKNLRHSVKHGGTNNNNWRPTRTAKRPVYLSSIYEEDKTFAKYFMYGDSFDLSYYQNILLTGSDREKEDARRDLNVVLKKLIDGKNKFKSMGITFNALALVMDGLLLVPVLFITQDPVIAMKLDRHINKQVKEIKIKLSIDDMIQSIEKLLEESDFETTTMNPLVYKKAANTPKGANIVQRNGKLMVEIKNTKTENNDNIRRVKKSNLPQKYNFNNYDLVKVEGGARK